MSSPISVIGFYSINIFHLFAVPPKIVTLRKPEPVRAGELLQLACTAKDSNPKTTLVWFRQDNPIPDGAGKYKY